jgi:hypothetical protein
MFLDKEQWQTQDEEQEQLLVVRQYQSPEYLILVGV